jgi:hypothetical protein
MVSPPAAKPARPNSFDRASGRQLVARAATICYSRARVKQEIDGVTPRRYSTTHFGTLQGPGYFTRRRTVVDEPPAAR